MQFKDMIESVGSTGIGLHKYGVHLQKIWRWLLDMDVNLRCYRKRGLRVPPGCAFGESPQIVDRPPSAGTGNRQAACECVVF